MGIRVDQVLYRGLTNTGIRVTYTYTYDDIQYCPIKQRSDTAFTMYPSYMICISEGYNMNSICIPSKHYFPFVQLLNKSVKTVSEHLYELYPDISNMEFSINSAALDKFKVDKAMSVAGMTVLPTVWVDETNQCYPALNIETLKGMCVIPFDDCMNINQMFSTFDPLSFGLAVLRIIGKID